MAEIKSFVEINDDELDAVAGGVIPQDVWEKMTTEERIAALRKSTADRKAGVDCILD